jgi:CBS domain containing-hemolysin-like protein
MEPEANFTADTINIGLTLIFIILNGFFVAAEFAMVKLTKSKVKTMIREKQPFANMAMWLFERQNMALSACQLGITMASLALGWIGEPAIAHLISPLIMDMGATSPNLIHGIAFAIAFSIITSLHIVIGEQVPKIYAIRRPGPVMLGSALLLKVFYVLLFPFMYVLNGITNFFLRLLGITQSGDHDSPLTEEEIRASLTLAYGTGELSKTEHKLLNAVFKFDDEVARKIMVPRSEVHFLEAKNSFSQNLAFIKESKHSRFPLCIDSLDNVIGVIHIKDILGLNSNDKVEFRDLARTPILIPENILISRLLQEFRSAKQHFAFVQDEHGTTLGIITLEDVLEELVGNLQDEFDTDEQEDIQKIDQYTYSMAGDVLIDEINDQLGLNLDSDNADTISGLIVEKTGYKLKVGSTVDLTDGVVAQIMELDGIRATKIKLLLKKPDEANEKLNTKNSNL